MFEQSGESEIWGPNKTRYSFGAGQQHHDDKLVVCSAGDVCRKRHKTCRESPTIAQDGSPFSFFKRAPWTPRNDAMLESAYLPRMALKYIHLCYGVY